MSTPSGPNLDRVIDAFVRLIEAATYADAIRRADELAMMSQRGRADIAQSLRNAAVMDETEARAALFAALGHERTMRLVPVINRVRYEAAARAEAAYEALPRAEQ